MKTTKSKPKKSKPKEEPLMFLMWPKYPFREKKIWAWYLPGQGPTSGYTRQPFTTKQLDDIEAVLKCPMELPALRAFLEQNCNITQLDSLTWPDILSHFQRYYTNNNKPGDNPKVTLREYITKNTEISDNFDDDDADNSNKVTSKITRIRKVNKTENILPPLANKPKKSQAHLYYEKDLDSIWPSLKDKIPTLPNKKT